MGEAVEGGERQRRSAHGAPCVHSFAIMLSKHDCRWVHSLHDCASWSILVVDDRYINRKQLVYYHHHQ